MKNRRGGRIETKKKIGKQKINEQADEKTGIRKHE